MTEPQKMGIQEVMGMIRELSTYAFSRDIEAGEEKIESALSAIIADRDALRDRVVVLEMAVKNYAGSSKDGVNFCRICTEYNFAPNPVNHRPDCIMRIVETKEPQ